MKGINGFVLFERVKLLERTFGVSAKDEWFDILLWCGSKGGVFGHCHLRVCKCNGKAEWVACSEEEELALMLKSYENDEHRVYGKGEPLAFWQYLDAFCYLGPAEFAGRRREIIEEVKCGA